MYIHTVNDETFEGENFCSFCGFFNKPQKFSLHYIMSEPQEFSALKIFVVYLSIKYLFRVCSTHWNGLLYWIFAVPFGSLILCNSLSIEG